MTERKFATGKTGGRKEVKLARYDLIPPDVMHEFAEHYGKGAEKYGDDNYKLGIPWSAHYAALMRHLQAWYSGEDIDEESGSAHLIAVVWHAWSLRYYQTNGYQEYDDRPGTVGREERTS